MTKIILTLEQCQYLSDELLRHLSLSTGWFGLDLAELEEVDGIEPEIED